MIEIFNNILPNEINRNIIAQLISSKNWDIGKDTPDLNFLVNDFLGPPGLDYGNSLLSFNEKENVFLDSPLNIYAEIIYFMVKKLTKYKFLKPVKFNFNYYNNSSHSTLHQDKEEKNFVSIVYNFNDNNGGTEIDGKFYKSNSGEAIVFPSCILHKGVNHTNTKGRFNLNIVVELENNSSL
jgi:hypothetical protein